MADVPAGWLAADVVRALQRTAVVTVAALAAGGLIVAAIAAFGHIEVRTIVGVPLAATGYAGSFSLWTIQSGYSQLVREPLAALAPDRRRAVSAAVLRDDDTAAMSLSWEERRRSVYFAQASIPRLVVTTVCTSLIYAGIFGVELMVDPGGWFDAIRAALLVIIAAIAVVSMPLTVVRVRRARAFLDRNAHVLDAPTDAD